MKIGLLAFSTDTGLGYQTHDFYRFMNPDKVLIADISRHNKLQTHHERFPGARIDMCTSSSYLSNESCEWLVDGMDIVFVCETPLNYYLYEYARKKGVKVVQQFNYEFLDYHRKKNLPAPTILAAPTLWNIDKVERLNITKVMHWPVPVDTDRIEYREIKEVKTLVHIIGRPAAQDRNGTVVFLKTARILGNKFKYKIYLQSPKEIRAISHFSSIKMLIDITKRELGDRLEIIENTPNNADMYKDGDILVLPRRYGGLCLPMWEALSSGMPVLMPNISPNDKILPRYCLIDSEFAGAFRAHTDIDYYDVDVNNLIERIQVVADNIESCSKSARKLALNMSWHKQREIYIQKMESVCD